MNAQLRSELLKHRTTRTAALLLLAAVALTLLGTASVGLSAKAEELAGEEKQRLLFAAGSVAMLFATYVGLIGMTSEFRYGTIRPSLLIQPRRTVVLAAKFVAAAIAGAVFGAVGVTAALAGGGALLSARGVGLVLDSRQVATVLLGTVVGCVLCAELGTALGALVRNQIGAIVALAAWAMVVETLLEASAPGIGRYLPGAASDALAGLPTQNLLTPVVGGVVLAAWAAALAVGAHLRTRCGDVA